jgi:hypothetical protein
MRLWFLIQFFNQVGAVADVQGGGVPYTAHVGGFIFGVITARIFKIGRTADVAPNMVCRRMCRTLRAGMRQYGLFRSFNKVLPCGLGCGQVIDFRR